jgi:hypothetical protein
MRRIALGADPASEESEQAAAAGPLGLRVG